MRTSDDYPMVILHEPKLGRCSATAVLASGGRSSLLDADPGGFSRWLQGFEDDAIDVLLLSADLYDLLAIALTAACLPTGRLN